MRTFLRVLLLFVLVPVYFSRAWSCTHVLGKFSPHDPVPYAKFDTHGLLAMTAWCMAVLFAVPIFWLAMSTVMEPPGRVRERPILSKYSLFSVAVVAVLLAMPTQAQIAYLVALPRELTAEIQITSALWALVVAAFTIVALRSEDLPQFLASKRLPVLLIVGIITVPKAILLGAAIVRV